VCRLHPRKVEEGEFRKSWQSTQAGVGGPGTHGFVGSLPSGISWRLAYYVTCINDSSRKIWVYFLNLKFDVFEVFKKWKVMVKIKTSLKLKYLRSHYGGEYEDGGFKLFYVVNGIRMEKTILGTPQQNGMAESINMTLNEHARSMRLHAGLPKTFWTNAVSIVAYLINRGPLVPLDHRLPREVLSENEVNLSHLEVESDAYSKLDAKSRKCYFIGYGDEAFEYRFWDE